MTGAGLFGDGLVDGSLDLVDLLNDVWGIGMRVEQRLDFCLQLGIVAAGLLQECCPFGVRLYLESVEKQRFVAGFAVRHDAGSIG